LISGVGVTNELSIGSAAYYVATNGGAATYFATATAGAVAAPCRLPWIHSHQPERNLTSRSPSTETDMPITYTWTPTSLVGYPALRGSDRCGHQRLLHRPCRRWRRSHGGLLQFRVDPAWTPLCRSSRMPISRLRSSSAGCRVNLGPDRRRQRSRRALTVQIELAGRLRRPSPDSARRCLGLLRAPPAPDLSAP
jgi:hypothetical protein